MCKLKEVRDLNKQEGLCPERMEESEIKPGGEEIMENANG